MKVTILKSILISLLVVINVHPVSTRNYEQEKELEKIIVQEEKNRLNRVKKYNELCGLEPLLNNQTIKQEKNKNTTEEPMTFKESWLDALGLFKRNALYISTAVGIYWSFCFIKRKINQVTHYLSQPTLWSSWRNDLSFNSLVSISKETLTQWILEDIQQEYLDNPIKYFYKDVQAEQVQLHEIVNLYDKLNFFYMVDDQALVDVVNRIKVLNLLKDLVLMWELEYAIAQAELNSSSAPQT